MDTNSIGTNDWISRYAALLVIAFYAGLIAYAISLTGAGTLDGQWVRFVYLLSGIEAIAFGAAGFLFGREIHRGQAAAAEQRAGAAEDRARLLSAEAAKGESLASAVLSHFEPRPDAPAAVRGTEGSGSNMRPAAAALQEMTARLYPHLQ